MSISLLELMIVSVIGILMLAGPVAAVALVVALSQGQPSTDGLKDALRRSSRTSLALCGVAIVVPAGLLAASGLIYLLHQGYLAMLSGVVVVGLVILLFVAIIAALVEMVQRERRAAGKPELSRAFIGKWTAIAMIPVAICVAAAAASTTTVVEVSRGSPANGFATSATPAATTMVQRITLEPQSSPASARGISMAGLGVFEILILAMAGFGIYRWTSSRSTQAATDQNRRSPVKMFAVMGALLLLALALGLGVSFQRHGMLPARVEIRHGVQEQMAGEDQLRSLHLPAVDRPQAALLVTDNDQPLSALDAANLDLPQSDRSITDEKLPDWITAGNSLVSGGRVLVISSQQYATAEEATADAQRQVMDLLGKDLALYQPNRFGLRRSVADGVGTGSVIKNTYLQTVQRDFGSFFAPMHRRWYQVELSPQTREAYLLAARDQAGPAHLGIVLAGFLSLLLAPVGIVIAGVLTRISSSGENSRPLWYGIIGGLVVGLWLVIAQVLNQFVVLW